METSKARKRKKVDLSRLTKIAAYFMTMAVIVAMVSGVYTAVCTTSTMAATSNYWGYGRSGANTTAIMNGNKGAFNTDGTIRNQCNSGSWSVPTAFYTGSGLAESTIKAKSNYVNLSSAYKTGGFVFYSGQDSSDNDSVALVQRMTLNNGEKATPDITCELRSSGWADIDYGFMDITDITSDGSSIKSRFSSSATTSRISTNNGGTLNITSAYTNNSGNNRVVIFFIVADLRDDGNVIGIKGSITGGCTHNWQETSRTNTATCTATGTLTVYKKCSICGATTSSSSASSALGHNYTYQNGGSTAATCTSNGSTWDNYKCSRCSATEKRNQKTVNALGHIHQFKTSGSNVVQYCSRSGCGTTINTYYPLKVTKNNTAGVASYSLTSDLAPTTSTSSTQTTDPYSETKLIKWTDGNYYAKNGTAAKTVSYTVNSGYTTNSNQTTVTTSGTANTTTWSTSGATVTLNAYPINYSISYTLNGGSITGQKTSYNIETASFPLPTPTRTGYTFAGWTGSNGSTKQTSVTVTKGTTGNLSYTANWTAQDRTIYVKDYNKNTSALLKSQTVSTKYDNTINVQTAGSTNSYTGYTYKSYAISPTNSFVVNSNSLTVRDNGATINRYWEPNKYTCTIKYVDEANKQLALKSASFDYDVVIDEDDVLDAAGKTGTNYDDWNSMLDGYKLTDISFTGLGTGNKVTGAFTATLTMKAAQSSLVINPNNGKYSGSTSNTTLTKSYGETASIAKPTRLGFDFNGWTCSNNFKGTFSGNTSPYTSMEYTFGNTDGASDTITAKWAKREPTIDVTVNDRAIPASTHFGDASDTTKYYENDNIEVNVTATDISAISYVVKTAAGDTVATGNLNPADGQANVSKSFRFDLPDFKDIQANPKVMATITYKDFENVSNTVTFDMTVTEKAPEISFKLPAGAESYQYLEGESFTASLQTNNAVRTIDWSYDVGYKAAGSDTITWQNAWVASTGTAQGDQAAIKSAFCEDGMEGGLFNNREVTFTTKDTSRNISYPRLIGYYNPADKCTYTTLSGGEYSDMVVATYYKLKAVAYNTTMEDTAEAIIEISSAHPTDIDVNYRSNRGDDFVDLNGNTEASKDLGDTVELSNMIILLNYENGRAGYLNAAGRNDIFFDDPDHSESPRTKITARELIHEDKSGRNEATLLNSIINGETVDVAHDLYYKTKDGTVLKTNNAVNFKVCDLSKPVNSSDKVTTKWVTGGRTDYIEAGEINPLEPKKSGTNNVLIGLSVADNSDSITVASISWKDADGTVFEPAKGAKVNDDGSYYTEIVADKNGVYTMTATDKAGNAYEETIEVTCFDDQAPTLPGGNGAPVENYDVPAGVAGIYVYPTGWSQSKTIFVDAKDDKALAAQAYSFSNSSTVDHYGASNTYVATTNETVFVKVKDFAGNEAGPFEVHVSQIDKDAPFIGFIEGKYVEKDSEAKAGINPGEFEFTIEAEDNGTVAEPASGIIKFGYDKNHDGTISEIEWDNPVTAVSMENNSYKYRITFKTDVADYDREILVNNNGTGRLFGVMDQAGNQYLAKDYLYAAPLTSNDKVKPLIVATVGSTQYKLQTEINDEGKKPDADTVNALALLPWLKSGTNISIMPYDYRVEGTVAYQSYTAANIYEKADWFITSNDTSYTVDNDKDMPLSIDANGTYAYKNAFINRDTRRQIVKGEYFRSSDDYNFDFFDEDAPSITLSKKENTGNTARLNINVTDEKSGIAKLEIKGGEYGEEYKAISVDALNSQVIGDTRERDGSEVGTVELAKDAILAAKYTVKATDCVGNISEESFTFDKSAFEEDPNLDSGITISRTGLKYADGKDAGITYKVNIPATYSAYLNTLRSAWKAPDGTSYDIDSILYDAKQNGTYTITTFQNDGKKFAANEVTVTGIDMDSPTFEAAFDMTASGARINITDVKDAPIDGNGGAGIAGVEIKAGYERDYRTLYPADGIAQISSTSDGLTRTATIDPVDVLLNGVYTIRVTDAVGNTRSKEVEAKLSPEVIADIINSHVTFTQSVVPASNWVNAKDMKPNMKVKITPKANDEAGKLIISRLFGYDWEDDGRVAQFTDAEKSAYEINAERLADANGDYKFRIYQMDDDNRQYADPVKELAFTISNIDTTKPSIIAGQVESAINISASDEQSGIAKVYIRGGKYEEDTLVDDFLNGEEPGSDKPASGHATYAKNIDVSFDGLYTITIVDTVGNVSTASVSVKDSNPGIFSGEDGDKNAKSMTPSENNIWVNEAHGTKLSFTLKDVAQDIKNRLFDKYTWSHNGVDQNSELTEYKATENGEYTATVYQKNDDNERGRAVHEFSYAVTNVDKDAPSVTAVYDKDDEVIRVEASDSQSGIARIEVYSEKEDEQYYGDDKLEFTYANTLHGDIADPTSYTFTDSMNGTAYTKNDGGEIVYNNYVELDPIEISLAGTYIVKVTDTVGNVNNNGAGAKIIITSTEDPFSKEPYKSRLESTVKVVPSDMWVNGDVGADLVFDLEWLKTEYPKVYSRLYEEITWMHDNTITGTIAHVNKNGTYMAVIYAKKKDGTKGSMLHTITYNVTNIDNVKPEATVSQNGKAISVDAADEGAGLGAIYIKGYDKGTDFSEVWHSAAVDKDGKANIGSTIGLDANLERTKAVNIPITFNGTYIVKVVDTVGNANTFTVGASDLTIVPPTPGEEDDPEVMGGLFNKAMSPYYDKWTNTAHGVELSFNLNNFNTDITDWIYKSYRWSGPGISATSEGMSIIARENGDYSAEIFQRQEGNNLPGDVIAKLNFRVKNIDSAEPTVEITKEEGSSTIEITADDTQAGIAQIFIIGNEYGDGQLLYEATEPADVNDEEERHVEIDSSVYLLGDYTIKVIDTVNNTCEKKFMVTDSSITVDPDMFNVKQSPSGNDIWVNGKTGVEMSFDLNSIPEKVRERIFKTYKWIGKGFTDENSSSSAISIDGNTSVQTAETESNKVTAHENGDFEAVIYQKASGTELIGQELIRLFYNIRNIDNTKPTAALEAQIDDKTKLGSINVTASDAQSGLAQIWVKGGAYRDDTLVAEYNNVNLTGKVETSPVKETVESIDVVINGEYTVRVIDSVGNETVQTIIIKDLPVIIEPDWVDYYKVDVKIEGKGTAKASTNDKGEASPTSLVYLSYMADPGYSFAGWRLDNAELIDGYYFVMPEENVTATAVFIPNGSTGEEVEKYNVTVTTNEGGQANVLFSNEWAQGSLVYLTYTADNDYRFKTWSSDDVTVKNNSFIMPGHDVTVNAEFVEDKSDEDPTTRYGVKVTSDGHGSATALFGPLFKAGERVYLTSTADEGYHFKEWEIVEGDITEIVSNSFIMPVGSVEVNAKFEEDENINTQPSENNVVDDKNINIDTDGDGEPDMNIDTDGDGIPDVNIDTDGNWYPDTNLDVDGDGEADHNMADPHVLGNDEDVDHRVTWKSDEDGETYVFPKWNDTDEHENPTNWDTNDDGMPDTNVDINGDQWPDINIDTNGDGTPDEDIVDPSIPVKPGEENSHDIDIDVDGDGIPDLNVDTDGDGNPDTNLDIDGDGEADINIAEPIEIDDESEAGGNAVYTVVDEDSVSGDEAPEVHYYTYPQWDDEDEHDNPTNKDTDDDGEPELNKDIDGDQWPDVNLDMDGDGVPDMNVDTDGEGHPDTNLDVDGDGKPDHNMADPHAVEDGEDTEGKETFVSEEDGETYVFPQWDDTDAHENPTNWDTNNDGNPDTNVDINGDQWPDINIDEDGDGEADDNIVDPKPTPGGEPENKDYPKPDLTDNIDVDTDGDGIPDLNVDTDRDGNPDTNLDVDEDGLPDHNIAALKPIEDGEEPAGRTWTKTDDPDGQEYGYPAWDDTESHYNPTNWDVDKDGRLDLNVDINDDQWPDINLDWNNDGKADSNIPDKSDVNVDADGDGNPDTNLDVNNDGVPDVNIAQKDDDGNYPDPDDKDSHTNPTNNDVDGDGQPDLNIDTDGDQWPDKNIDVDGDGVPDINVIYNNITVRTDGNGAAGVIGDTRAFFGQHVQLAVMAYDGYEFDRWVVEEGDVEIDENNMFVMPNKAVRLRALFKDGAVEDGKHSVTILTQGEGGQAAVAGTGRYAEGETVYLAYTITTAGVTLKEWKSDDVNVVSGKFTMPGNDVVITAVFDESGMTGGQYKVTVITDGNGVALTPGSMAYGAGDKVKLVAAAYAGYMFKEWSSEDVEIAEDNTFTMPAKDVTIKASFRRNFAAELGVTDESTGYTKGDVTVKINVPAEAEKQLDDMPFSWDNGETWTDDVRYVIHENGTYSLLVKLIDGTTVRHLPVVIDRIDRNAPTLNATAAPSTISIFALDDKCGIGVVKITGPDGKTVAQIEDNIPAQYDGVKLIDIPEEYRNRVTYHMTIPTEGEDMDKLIYGYDYEYGLKDDKTFALNVNVDTIGQYKITAYDRLGNETSTTVNVKELQELAASEIVKYLTFDFVPRNAVNGHSKEAVDIYAKYSLSYFEKSFAAKPFAWIAQPGEPDEDTVWQGIETDSNNEHCSMYTATENGQYKLFIKLSNGEIVESPIITVNQIDREAPNLSVTAYDMKLIIISDDAKSGLADVRLYDSANEEIDTMNPKYSNGGFLADGSYKLEQDVTKDGKYIVIATDALGNEVTEDIKVATRFLGIVQPDPITGLRNGTPKTVKDLKLPETVKLLSNNANLQSAPITWDLDNLMYGTTYDPSLLTEQIFVVKGTISLPEYVETGSVPTWTTISVTVNATAEMKHRFLEKYTTPDGKTGADTVEKLKKITGNDEMHEVRDENVQSEADDLYISNDEYAVVTMKKVSFPYTGAEILPKVKVTYMYKEIQDDGSYGVKEKKLKLKENADYVVTYKNNIHAGKGTVVLTGTGDYRGVIRKEFDITKKDMKKVKAEAVPSVLYTGKDLTKTISMNLVLKDKDILVDPSDYVLEFSDRPIGEAGANRDYTFTVKASEDGSYTGALKKPLTVTVVGSTADGSMADAKVELNLKKQTVYTGKPVMPKATVMLGGTKLKAKRDYTLVFENNINVGTAKVYAVGTGNYHGRTQAVEFNIAPKDFSKVKVSKMSQISFRTSIEDLKPIVKDGKTKLVNGVDYVMNFEDMTEWSLLGLKVKTAKIILKATNTNYIGEKTITVAVKPRNLKSRLTTKVLVGEGYLNDAYDAAQPEVEVYYNNMKLRVGEDFTVKYSGNTKAGKTGKATITGVGNYTGKRTVKFMVKTKNDSTSENKAPEKSSK